MDSEQQGYIDCDEHGRQFGYAVCQHIVNDRSVPVAGSDEATVDLIGSAICQWCADRVDHLQSDNYKLICQLHLDELLIGRPKLQ